MSTSFKKMNYIVFYAIRFALMILLALSTCSMGLRLHAGNYTQLKTEFLTPRIRYLSTGPFAYPIEGPLIYVGDRLPQVNVSGAIVLYKTRNMQVKERTCQLLKDSGAIALIVQFQSRRDYPGLGEYSRRTNMHPSQPFPVFEVTLSQSQKLEDWIKSVGEGAIVSIDGEATNPWDAYMKYHFTILTFVTLVSSSFLLTIATFKLTMLVVTQGWQLSIGQCVLVANIFSAVIRCIWCIVDPFGMYQRVHNMWVQIGTTLPFAPMIGACLLIALYWHEMIKRTGARNLNLFLDQMKWTFLGIVAFLFVFELVTSIGRGIGLLTSVLSLLNGVVYAIIILTVFIFFVVTQIRVIRVFHKLNKRLESSTKGQRLHIANQLVSGIGAMMLCYLGTVVFIGFSPLFWTPNGYLITWTVLFTATNIMSLLQILLIRVPTRSWRWILCGLCIENPDELIHPSTKSGSTSFESGTGQTSLSQQGKE